MNSTLSIKETREEVKNVTFSDLSIYYTGKNIISSHKNNKFKIYAPT